MRKMIVMMAALLLLLASSSAGAEPDIVITFPDAGEEINTTVMYDGFSVAPNGTIVIHSDFTVAVEGHVSD